MQISLVIPVYNVKEYITGCLKSVMNQTFDKFECVIVNDKSPDESIDIAKKMIAEYKGNICFRIINHNENKGLPNARNTGIVNSTGDYVTFLDSDDTITADYISTMQDIIIKYPEVELVQCGIKITDKNRIFFNMTSLPEQCYGKHCIFREFLRRRIPWLVHSKMVRRQFIIENNLLFDNNILIHEDLYWTYLLTKAVTSMVSSKKEVYIYNTSNSGSIMQQSNLHFERSAHNYIIILDRFIDNIDTDNFTDNWIFIENLFFYLTENIRKSCDIQRDTKKAYKKLRWKILKKNIYFFNLPDLLYQLHFFKPFYYLTHISAYRRIMLYRYENATRWYYHKITKKK